jgi:elongation factor 2
MHLPSPAAAQRFRCEAIYKGPRDDEFASAIANCDKSGSVPFVHTRA